MRRKQSFEWTHLFPEYRCFHHRPAIELYYACYRNVRKSDDVTARAFLAWQFSLWPNVPFRVPFLFLFASIAANDKKIDWKFNKYNYLPLNLKIETVVLFSVFFVQLFRSLTEMYLLAFDRINRLDVFFSSCISGSWRFNCSKHSLRCARRFFSNLLCTSRVPALWMDALRCVPLISCNFTIYGGSLTI